MTDARDPYKYFRIEARELHEGLSQGILALEKAPPSGEQVAHLLRLAHTLKGASRVVKLPAIAEHAHAIEDILAPYRARPVSPERDRIDALLGLLDAVATSIAAIDPVPALRPERPAAREEPFETVRVELREMDVLLEGIRETGARLGALRRQGTEVERARRLAEALVDELDPGPSPKATARAHEVASELRAALQRHERSLGGGIDHVQRELGQVRDSASHLRLLPASTVLAMLERAARDAAQSTHKRVEFRMAGGTTRLDAGVLGALQDALLHVVRNAVAHGIEPEGERQAGGKPAVARIELTVERRGGRVTFLCADDGRGIDVEALKRAAIREGMLTAETSATLTSQEALRLLLQGGLTTARTITDLSGRGIGLDVVRTTAEGLKGEVRIDSEPGRGTRLAIVVPVSLAALPVLTVEASGTRAALPFDAVRATLRLADASVARSSGHESMVHEGRAIPFVPLGSLLGRPDSIARRPAVWSAVIVQAGDALAAFGVDHVYGTTHAVVRPLPGDAEIEALVAGACLDEEGNPVVVLDPTALVAGASRPSSRTANGRATRRAILVIDDSLTTRMLEQSILETAGYEVDLATSAEEALGKARQRRYGLFLVDVEMPGMDGFQFVAQTRADAAMRETPAILVTSLASPQHRVRGQKVGASAFISKGEFDQAFFLRTIRDLIR